MGMIDGLLFLGLVTGAFAGLLWAVRHNEGSRWCTARIQAVRGDLWKPRQAGRATRSYFVDNTEL